MTNKKNNIMAQKIIELSGIVRNMPDNTVKEGTMQELINLRPRDGALRPVGSKAKTASVSRDVRFIHSVSDTVKIHIGVYTDPLCLSYWVFTNDIPGSEVVTTVPVSSDMSFAPLKNSLLVSNNTTEIKTLLIFSEDTGLYTVFHDNIFPSDMPSLIIQRIAVPGDDESGDNFEVGPDVDPGEVELSQYVKMQKDKGDDGYLSGKVLVRFAWELFDGTLVKHTLPDLISTSEITTTSAFGATYLGGTSPGWRITTTFFAYALQFQIVTSVYWFSDFYTKYQNIIRSLRIYVSLPKSPELEVIKETRMPYTEREKTVLGSVLIPRVLVYNVSELKNYSPDPTNEQYFLLKEFTLKDLDDAIAGIGTWRDIDTDSVQDLSTRDQLPVDNFSHHKLFGKRLFSYNERIFIGDIKNTLYQGFSLEGMLNYQYPETTGPTYNVGIEYDIIVDGNKKITVFSGWKQCEWYSPLNPANINFSIKYTVALGYPPTYIGYWGYPDARATIARVYVQQGGEIRLIHTQALESHKRLNFALARGLNVGGLFSSFPLGTLVADKTTYYDYNRVQATELNNPFYFPAINSYRIGLGKILGLSSNAIALSTGQFGQFPVYCFTTDGIWTMSIGTGETLINTITTLSREVCNNPASITPIDGGTVFTTGKGLFIITGNQAVEISQTAEGVYRGHVPSALYADVIENPATSAIPGLLCLETFLTYIANAKIAWDYINREIIVCNASYNYSWVFSVDHKMWFKISEVFLNFVYDFPLCYGFRTFESTYYRFNMNAESFTEPPMVYAETRPLKLSEADFKKLNRLLLQGYINTAPLLFGLYMAGTTDNKTWFQLNNTRYFYGQARMLLNRSQYSCMYFILAFGGVVDEEAYFNYINIDFEERYKDKLR